MSKRTCGYGVGYGRPPQQHQFKPGRSGNPTGRPKGVRNFKSDLRDELAELISIKDGDKTVELTRQRAVIKAIVKAAVEGDLRAANAVLTLCSHALTADAEPSADDTEVAAADQAIADASAKRQRMGADTTSKTEL
jgi:Family of unknown function (DUF5681)